MISIEKSVHINKPRAEVFAFMSDFANDAKWQADLVRSEKTSLGPIAVGTTGLYVQKLLGRELKNDVVVTVYEPPSRFGMKTTSGPIQFEANVTLDEMDGGTHLIMRADGEPGGVFKVAEGILKKELEKTFERDLGKLKKILEG